MRYIDNDDILLDEAFFEVGDDLVLEVDELAFDEVSGIVVDRVCHIFQHALEDVDL